MGVAKVILNSQTLMDVTQKTVTSSNLLSGYTALGADGEAVVGSYIPSAAPVLQSKTVDPSTSAVIVTPDEGKDTPMNNVTTSASSGGTTTGVSYSVAYTKRPLYARLNGSITLYWANQVTNLTWTFNNAVRERTGEGNQTTWLMWAWDGSTYQGVTIDNPTLANSSIRSLNVSYANGSIIIRISTEDAAVWSMDLTNITLEMSDDINFSEGFDGLSQVTVNPIPSSYIIPAGTLSISANGTYGVTSYASVDVNVAGGGGDGITADQIALRTISGSIGGSASQVYSYAFRDNSQITEASFPNCINVYSYAFYGCSSLSSINFPSCVSIYDYAFTFCTHLSGTLSFPSCISLGNGAFSNCQSIGAAYFPSCTLILNAAFNNCVKLSSIYFPEVTRIQTSAFLSCSLLTEASFPKCTYLSGSSIFYNCSSLVSASFPVLTSMTGSYMFGFCSNLTTFYAPEFTSASYGTFYYCRKLESVSFPKLKSVTTYMFFENNALSEVYLPSVSSVMASAFGSCGALLSISLPECTHIGVNAFERCHQLSCAIFPKLSSILNSAFYLATRLASLYLLSSSVVSIYGSAVFNNTPFQTSGWLGYFGSIYVPESLIDSYKTTTNWSYFSDRFVGLTDAEITTLLGT